jgi:putative addiction module antidote
MNKPVKLVAIGNSTGVILPKEILAKLQVGQGDSLSISATKDSIELRLYEADFAAQMDAARAVMQRRRAALRELAK